MEKPIMKDMLFLGMKSLPATEHDRDAARDLLDTLAANREVCIGMAANMIGVRRRIIAFADGEKITLMYNPEIIKCSGAYTAEEGCLSLEGKRLTKRFSSVKVRFQNESFETRVKSYSGLTAQIIQHETDHCNGIII